MCEHHLTVKSRQAKSYKCMLGAMPSSSIDICRTARRRGDTSFCLSTYRTPSQPPCRALVIVTEPPRADELVDPVRTTRPAPYPTPTPYRPASSAKVQVFGGRLGWQLPRTRYVMARCASGMGNRVSHPTNFGNYS